MVTKSARILNTGGGAITLGAALGLTGVKARAVQLIGDSLNSGSPLIGGFGMTPGDESPAVAGTGFPIGKTAPLYLPYTAVWTDMYDFDHMYVFVNVGDILYILYEQG